MSDLVGNPEDRFSHNAALSMMVKYLLGTTIGVSAVLAAIGRGILARTCGSVTTLLERSCIKSGAPGETCKSKTKKINDVFDDIS